MQECFCLKNLFCLYLKSQSFVIAFLLLFSTTLGNNGEFGGKKYFTGHRTANTIQVFVAIKGYFAGLFFF